MKELTFTLKFIQYNESQGFGFYDTYDIDITEKIIDFDVDAIKFVDEETLLINERKASISILNYNDTINEYKAPLIEQTETIETGEYDLVNNPEDENDFSDRLIKFVVPFIDEVLDINTHQNYLGRRRVFPASYNPGENETDFYTPPSISLIPVRNHDEEEYNSYGESYVIEKPYFLNIILEVKDKSSNIIYTGLAEIESYSYDPSTLKTSISFTDTIGIMIKCLDSWKNLPTFFQNVFNSGLTLNDSYDIAQKTVNAMYPQLSGIFYFPYYTSGCGRYLINMQMRCGMHHEHTEYRVWLYDIINGGNPINLPTFYREGRERPYILSNSNITGNIEEFWQDEYNIYITSTESAEFAIDFVEKFKFNTECIVNVIKFHISILESSLITLEVTENTFNMLDSDYESWRDGIYYPNWTNLLFENGWENFHFNGYIPWESYIYGGEMEVNNIEIQFGEIDENLFNIISLCNDEGFNTNPDVLSVFKMLLFSRIIVPYTDGYSISFTRFQYPETPNNTLDGYYITKISINDSYYETPDLKDFEQITDWDRKKIKQKIKDKMNIIESSLIKKYTINISSAINKIYKLGDKIHIYNVDDINTDGIDIIVTSIQYSRDDIKVEGYGL